jgi:hypothetical protein
LTVGDQVGGGRLTPGPLTRFSTLRESRIRKEKKMNWIFGAFLGASLLHMGEEYFYPGGFMDFMKHLNSKFASLVTKPMAIVVNGLQLLLCIVVMIVGKSALVFGLSVAALLFINGLAHILGCIKAKGYSPGVITGILLYIPLAIYAYFLAIGSGLLNASGIFATGVLGLLYQAVPLGYFVLASAMKRT